MGDTYLCLFYVSLGKVDRQSKKKYMILLMINLGSAKKKLLYLKTYSSWAQKNLFSLPKVTDYISLVPFRFGASEFRKLFNFSDANSPITSGGQTHPCCHISALFCVTVMVPGVFGTSAGPDPGSMQSKGHVTKGYEETSKSM